jgi:hypothetical protein
MGAEGVPLLVGDLAERRRAVEVGGGVAVAQRHGGVARAEEGGVLAVDAAVAARRDVDVAGQRIVAVAEQFGAHRAEVRPLHRRLLPPAGVHDVGALAVIVLRGVQAAHEGHAVHLLGRVRQQLADVDAGHRGRDRLEGTAGRGARLGVPGFELARPAVQPDDEDALLGFLQLARDGRPGEGAKGQRPQRAGCHAGEEAPPREGVFRRVASVRALHEILSVPASGVA